MVKRKMCIIGAGMVGSATMMAILNLNLVAEIVLIDQNEKKAEGEALDVFHTTSFTYVPNVMIRKGSYEDCKDSQIIVMSAGPSIKPGEKPDRRILTQTNANVTRAVMKEITRYTQEAILIFVSNPVDVVTYIAQNEFGYPRHKIFGTGTLLDTARMRRIIGEHYLVDTKNVHGYVLGEHGQTAFITWSICNIGGIPIDSVAPKFKLPPIDKEEILKKVKNAGLEILLAKGYTNYGIAESVARIVTAICLNELSVLPVTTTLEGEYGITNVAISVPCIIGKEGIHDILEIPLSLNEQEALKKSAESVMKLMSDFEII
ncbi:L-lactate dehydrogenase [Sporanaerobium hydrogeniformans]|uniref:L-lactate dehydrogenase n=1 Tax=Sporanaerobium hydrogeniformans TaxID=3072179 RepID=A0AC61DHV3_9FIRM|nr:L-lactate dehydrogenase [Sporanaerobium hydrogeniformans]PHV72468.1 L-lactate dehydrogenase [Sporanaerobium hydrogeniformans]